MTPFFSEEELGRCGLAGESFCRGGSGRGEHVLLRRRPAVHPGYECPGFVTGTNLCSCYQQRPLDCAIYPFVLMYSEAGDRALLALDPECPYALQHAHDGETLRVSGQVAAYLDSELSSQIAAGSGLIGEFNAIFQPVGELPRTSRTLCRTDLGLKRLTLSTRPLVEPFFAARERELSAHSFESIWLWRDFFDLRWKIVGDRLLVVAEDRGAAFLFVPPLGRGPLEPATREGWELLCAIGGDSPAARIENVGDDDLHALQALGGSVQSSTEEFIGERSAWDSLSGEALKGQRAACNHFEKHNDYRWRPFERDDLPGAISLYRRWAAQRKAKHPDPFFAALIDNSFLAHVRALRQATLLGLTARVVEIDKQIVGYTFGCALPGGSTFAVLGEVADLSYKGLAPFIFRQLCREAHPCRWVNVMGDSGLPNLRAAKLQYHPARTVAVHTVGLRPTPATPGS